MNLTTCKNKQREDKHYRETCNLLVFRVGKFISIYYYQLCKSPRLKKAIIINNKIHFLQMCTCIAQKFSRKC